MQPGAPGPGQDPYQQYPPSYGQVPPYSDPYGAPQYDAPQSPVQPVQPAEYTLFPPVSAPPPQSPMYPPVSAPPPQYPPGGGYGVPMMMPMQMRPANTQNNVLGLLSMIFGIISIPLLFCCYIGIPLGIAAIVLGILGNAKANEGKANNKGMSIAGIATGSATIAILVLIIILYFAVGMSAVLPTSV